MALREDAPYTTCLCGVSFNTDLDSGKAARRHQKICKAYATVTEVPVLAPASTTSPSALSALPPVAPETAATPDPDESPSIETGVQSAPEDPPTYAVGNEWENDGLPLDPAMKGIPLRLNSKLAKFLDLFCYICDIWYFGTLSYFVCDAI